MKLSWLQSLAVLLAACTVILILSGDFYSTNEYRPFYSLGQLHITVGWTVAALTVAAAIPLLLRKTSKTRALAWLILAALSLETLVGFWSDPEAKMVNVTHAFLGQVFFALIAVMVLFTSRGWNADGPTIADRPGLSISSLSGYSVGIALLQVALGACLRHGLIAVIWHILGAFLVIALILPISLLLRHQEDHTPLRPIAKAAAIIASTQAFIGFIVLSIESSQKMPPEVLIVAAAIHAAVAALTLGAIVVAALMIRRRLRI
jgi:heme A synthase